MVKLRKKHEIVMMEDLISLENKLDIAITAIETSLNINTTNVLSKSIHLKKIKFILKNALLQLKKEKSHIETGSVSN